VFARASNHQNSALQQTHYYHEFPWILLEVFFVCLFFQIALTANNVLEEHKLTYKTPVVVNSTCTFSHFKGECKQVLMWEQRAGSQTVAAGSWVRGIDHHWCPLQSLLQGL
jgi:hypothetical protein